MNLELRADILNTTYAFTEKFINPFSMIAVAESKILNFISIKGSSEDELCKKLKLQRPKVNALLRHLQNLEFVTKSNDIYYAKEDAKELFTQKGENSLSHHLKKVKMDYTALLDLGNSNPLKEKKFAYEESSYEEVKVYQKMVKSFNLDWISLYIEEINKLNLNIENFLDLGGGHGKYSSELLKLYPTSKAGLLDMNHAIQVSKGIFKNTPEEKRIEFIIQNIIDYDINKTFDFMMMNDVLHYFPFEEKQDIISYYGNLINKGGYLMITKFHLKDDMTPSHNFDFSFKNFVKSGKGMLGLDSEIEKIAYETGFELHHRNVFEELKTLFIFKKVK